MTRPTSDDRLLEHLLVLRAQTGDRAAFGELCERYSAPLRYYLRRLLGATPDADDALQDTWLSVVRKVSSLEDPGAFRAWLYRIARNHVHSRARDNRFEHSLDEAPDGEALSRDEDELSLLEEHEASAVHAGLDRLPTAQREVLTLRFIEDLSYEEVAAVVGCSVGTVRSRIHYGKKKLRSELDRRASHRSLSRERLNS